MSALPEENAYQRIVLGVLLVLTLVVCVQAQPGDRVVSLEMAHSRGVNASLGPQRAATAVPPLWGALVAAEVATLWDDPMAARNPSVRRWPWWARLVAVVGVVLFVRLAVSFARGTDRSR